MEIIYAYVGEFKNIEDQGFNFSSRFWVDFNPSSKELIIEEREDYIPNFFGHRISNVTAIVGKNGAGKSNLLEFLVNHIAGNTPEGWKEPALIVWFHRKEIFYKSNLEVSRDNIKYVGKFDINKLNNGNGRIYNIAYYSNFYDDELRSFQDDYNHYIIDLSTNQRARLSNFDLGLNPEYRFLSFRAKEIRAQSLLFGIMPESQYMDINIPDLLVIDVKLDYLLRKSQEAFLLDTYESDEVVKALEVIVNQLAEKDSKNIEKIKAAFFCSVIYGGTGMVANNDPVSYILNLSERLQKGEKISDYELFNIPFLGNLVLEHVNFEKVIELLDFIRENQTDIFRDGQIVFKKADTEKLKTFFELVNDSAFTRLDPFNYDWQYIGANRFGGLSSGEKSFLTLLARFFVQRERILPGCIILLDEADIAFHPQWQKKLLKYFLEFLESGWFIGSNYEVQLILAAHSPFVISDLPIENVVFLDKDESGKLKVVEGLNKERTFAANIHTLFSDSFFIQDGVIGDFSKSKIEGLIEDIKEFKNRSNVLGLPQENRLFYLRKMIEKIGEPIIRRKLENLLEKNINRDR